VSDAWSPHSYAPHNNQTEDTMGAPHSAGHTPTDGRSNPSPPPAAGQKSATVTRGLSEDACPHQGGGRGGGRDKRAHLAVWIEHDREASGGGGGTQPLDGSLDGAAHR
jgi:hypothetical protein